MITLSKLKFFGLIFIIFVTGLILSPRPVAKPIERIIEKPVEKIVEKQIVSEAAKKQITNCQAIIKIDDQGFNVASKMMSIVPEALTAVANNNVTEINSLADTIKSYNADLDNLTAQKQAIIDSCMNVNP